MRAAFAHWLFFLAAWTVVIKFAFPVAFALAEGVEPGRYVMLDFWWVVHGWLGYALLRRTAYAYWLAVGTAVAESVIVVTKFALFLPDPRWDIWQAGWFVNKCFVLALFVWMLGWLVITRPFRRADGLASGGS